MTDAWVAGLLFVSADGARLDRYLREWTMWNEARTVASTAACAAFGAAL